MTPELSLLDKEQITQFNDHGWLITQTLDGDKTARLQTWVQEIQDLPDTGP